jgi:hypothetical protein
MKLREKKPALILIDIQKGFLDEDYWGGNRNNKNAEEISGTILNKWRNLACLYFISGTAPLIQIQNYMKPIQDLNLMNMFFHWIMNPLLQKM